jgi:transcriptional regulator with XRE-family HTH domain
VVDVDVTQGIDQNDQNIDEDRRYARSLGERLRRVRQQQNLSLHDVEARSHGELKASVVGAYERGERAVSITRLQVLAGFYRVPVAELLPEPIGIGVTDDLAAEVDAGDVVIDLVALEEHRDDEPVLARYVESIQARRGDYNGRVLTVRAGDLATLAAVLDRDPDELQQRLSSVGIVR